MKTILLTFLTLCILITISISFFSCKSDSTNPENSNSTYDANSINGTISFVDNNFTADTINGYYDISAFSSWPPTGNATASAKLKPVLSGGKYTAIFKIIVPANGQYTITSSYIKLPYSQGSVLGLGIYEVAGRDTVHNDSLNFQVPHPKAIITNGTGIGNVDFNSWLDTAKYIYKF